MPTSLAPIDLAVLLASRSITRVDADYAEVLRVARVLSALQVLDQLDEQLLLAAGELRRRGSCSPVTIFAICGSTAA